MERSIHFHGTVSIHVISCRLVQRRAVEDPFLMEVTPDGIPIEEATSTDLRRGESYMRLHLSQHG